MSWYKFLNLSKKNKNYHRTLKNHWITYFWWEIIQGIGICYAYLKMFIMKAIKLRKWILKIVGANFYQKVEMYVFFGKIFFQDMSFDRIFNFLLEIFTSYVYKTTIFFFSGLNFSRCKRVDNTAEKLSKRLRFPSKFPITVWYFIGKTKKL